MARHWKIAIAALVVLALIGLATLPALLRTVLGLHGGVSEEQARRELSQPLIATPSDTPVMAQLFWISATSPAALDAVSLQLPLSTNPVQRAKQLIAALITQAPSLAQRTLPADTELLQFYLLPDGTAIADFSEALSTETPSGILSEQLAVDSLVRTLAENVNGVHQLKILIQGQETNTLAGHLDLSDPFSVEALAPATGAPPPNPIAAAPPPQPPANAALPLASSSLASPGAPAAAASKTQPKAP